LNQPGVSLADMRSFLFVVGVSLSLILSGCGTPPDERLDAPVGKVAGLVVHNDTGVLTLRFSNSNIVPMVISSSSHSLSLGDKSIGTIDDAEAIGLPPLGYAVHTVKLPAKVAQAAQAYLIKNPGAVRVSVKSSLELVTTADEAITLKSFSTGLIRTE
jgi:LEA14-like dessication related protein